MTAFALAAGTVLIATPLPGGGQILVPRLIRPRICHRPDGTAKIAFEKRADARRSSSKHEHVYRCKFCGACHLATARRNPKVAASDVSSNQPRIIRKAA